MNRRRTFEISMFFFLFNIGRSKRDSCKNANLIKTILKSVDNTKNTNRNNSVRDATGFTGWKKSRVHIVMFRIYKNESIDSRDPAKTAFLDSFRSESPCLSRDPPRVRVPRATVYLMES